MELIKFENVSKYYGEFCALHDVNLGIERSGIYGLLGKNGAGKSTLINILTNRIFSTNGRVYVNGEIAKENDRVQGLICCMSEKGGYPNDLKVEQAFKWAKRFHSNFDLNYAMELAKKFQLDLKKKLSQLSTGNKTIYKAIITLASNSEVMIFDEPALGLDAQHRDMFYKELVVKFDDLNNTMIISTHLIDEVANLLNHVIIMDAGKIIIDDGLDEILSTAYTIGGSEKLVDEYCKDKKVIKSEKIGNFKTATIYQKLTEKEKEHLTKMNFEIDVPKLQELFISLTNKGDDK